MIKIFKGNLRYLKVTSNKIYSNTNTIFIQHHPYLQGHVWPPCNFLEDMIPAEASRYAETIGIIDK
jgi:hypothetical protein